MWNKRNSHYIMIGDDNTPYRRLDRSDKHQLTNLSQHTHIINDIINHKYTDYHMLRPHSEYEKENNEIMSYLLINN